MTTPSPVHWDLQLTTKLMELGLSWEHARIATGLAAEERLQADREGYIRGYNNGYADAQKKFHAQAEKEKAIVIAATKLMIKSIEKLAEEVTGAEAETEIVKEERDSLKKLVTS